MRISKGKPFSVLTALLLAFSLLPFGLIGTAALSDEYVPSAPYSSSPFMTELEEIELTGDHVSDIIRIALSQQNYHEGDSPVDLAGSSAAGSGNYTEYGWWYGRSVCRGYSGYWGEWSGAFISWCARQAEIPVSMLPNYATGSMFRIALDFYPAHTSIPQKGDIVYFRDCDGSPADHVGLVFSVTAYEIMTVEGDAEGAVRVCEYFLDDNVLYGYGRPAYFVGTEGEASSSSSSTAPLTVEELRKKFPNGKYWNGGNPDKYTSTPCTHHKTTGCSYYGGCFCNVFYNSISNCIQCQGFSMKMGYDAYGINPYLWQQDTDPAALDRLKPGDIIRYKNNGHTIFVLGVNDGTITYADCNSDYQCVIRWDAEITIAKIRSTFSYVRVAPYTLDSNGLAVQFNANGGTVPGSGRQTVYTAIYDNGLNLRANPAVASDLLGVVPKNTRFLVTQTATGNGYSWGKINYNGITGWVVISVTKWVKKATSRITDYYVGASGTIYSSIDSSIFFQSFKYGTTYKSGLRSAADFGIERSGYDFLGWSLSQTGDTVLKAGTSITADKIVKPSFSGGQNVVLYAVWRPMIPETGTFTASVSSAAAGDTVKFTFKCSNATKYDISISKGTKTVYSVNGTANATISYKFTEPGTYTVSGTAYNSYGSNAATSLTYTVSAPKYTLRFDPNGGTIPGEIGGGEVYEVTTANGLRMREAAGTVKTVKVLCVLPKGVQVVVTEKKETTSYLWGKITWEGQEGWIAYYDKAKRVSYAECRSDAVPGYMIDDGLICSGTTGKAYELPMTFSVQNETGLPAPEFFGLENKGYRFVGWSTDSKGTKIYQPDVPITLNMTGVTNIRMYAIWEQTAVPGDINGDGVVGSSDLLALRNMFANMVYDENSGAEDLGNPADVNHDGMVSTADLLLLRIYLANYDYSTGKSTVELG